MTNEEYWAWIDAHNKKGAQERQRAYYHANRDKCLAQSKKWVKDNPDKVKAYRKKRSNDPYHKIAESLRIRMYQAIRGNFKSGSAVRDLGCTIPEFKDYIAAKFTDGMSWDNHGEWHLDHIRPLASFDLSDREQFLQAAHYTNFQPLWAIDNLKKGHSYEVSG